MSGRPARFARRVWRRLRRGSAERRMADEMQFHLDMETAELRRSGLSAAEAHRGARLAFGGVERFKEESRDAFGTRLFDDGVQDLRYALRQLRASPGFTIATVFTLALGIGATTLMQTYRRSITAPERTIAVPERVIVLGQGRRDCVRCARIAPASYQNVRDQSRTLSSVSLLRSWDPVLRGTNDAELLDGAQVTPEFFRTLGIPAMLGRTLAPVDSAPDRRQVAVISERAWRVRFRADRAVLGTTLMLDRQPYAIVGVVADARAYPQDVDVWVPLVLTPAESRDRTGADLVGMGRMRDGVTVAMVSDDLRRIGAEIAAGDPALAEMTLSATPLPALEALDDDPQTVIYSLAVGLVLLVACVNLAGLLIARLSARRRELAVRAAMGASRARIVRQLVVETMLIATIGSAIGALFAVWAVSGLIGWRAAVVDLRAFAIALASGLGCGLVIGLWPALRFARPAVLASLSDRAATGTVDGARGRRVLVGVEVALAIVLLSAAGLLARSFSRMVAFDPGFRTDDLLALRVRIPPGGARDLPGALGQAVAAVPVVAQAGITLGIPFGHGWSTGPVEVAGEPPREPDARPRVRLQATTPGYFAALGVTLLRGRLFDDRDRAGTPRVAMLNEAAAERLFPGADPIGRAVVIDSLRWDIVGVVRTVFTGDFEQLAAPDVYRPFAQWGGDRRLLWVVVRTAGDRTRASAAVTAAIRRLDPDVAVTRLLSMDALRDNDMGSERQTLRLMSGFALAALVIAAIGLYGVISYSVAQRRRELGIRLALGASRRVVLGLVLGEGVRLAALGAAAGVVVAVGVLRVMRTLLFRISPADPLTLAAVAITIGAVALAAAYVPARRAMRVDPMTSLRND